LILKNGNPVSERKALVKNAQNRDFMDEDWSYSLFIGWGKIRRVSRRYMGDNILHVLYFLKYFLRYQYSRTIIK